MVGTVLSKKISRNILSILKPDLKKGINISYFFSFDESWKVDSKEDIQSYWDIWDKDEQLKFGEYKSNVVFI